MNEEKSIPKWAGECLHCKNFYTCTLFPAKDNCLNFKEMDTDSVKNPRKIEIFEK